ncbi:MAG: hypothetical protein QF922_00520, partial [SAR324 cluster bacterium]|nr:hypothetical protein [SAR324 cluster bacterium]
MGRIGIDLGGTKMEIILTTGNPMEVLERHRVPNLLPLPTSSTANSPPKSVRTRLATPAGGMGLPRSHSPMPRLLRCLMVGLALLVTTTGTARAEQVGLACIGAMLGEYLLPGVGYAL